MRAQLRHPRAYFPLCGTILLSHFVKLTSDVFLNKFKVTIKFCTYSYFLFYVLNEATLRQMGCRFAKATLWLKLNLRQALNEYY